MHDLPLNRHRSPASHAWMAALMLASVSASAATVSWKSAVAGSWSDGTKWSSGSPPGPADTAVIDVAGTYTVTLNSVASVDGLVLGSTTGAQTLQFAGGTLNLSGSGLVGTNGVVNFPNGVIDGAGTLTVRGTLNWSGGTMQGGTGKTVLAPESKVTLASGNLIQRTVDNSTTVTFTGTTGHLQIGQGVVWNNLAGSVFDIKAENYVLGAYGGSATFNNAGSLRRSTGTSLGVFDFTVNNAGFVEITSGQTSFRAGGTLGGTWSAGNGATLQFGGGTFENTGGTIFNGAGRLLVQGGTVRIANAQSVTSFLELGNGGVIDGAATLTINGRFDWTGGVMQGAGKTILSASSTPTIGGGGFIQRTIDNSASVVFTGATGHFQIGQGCVWNNLAGSVFDAKADNYVLGAYGGAATFNNAGTVRRSAGTSLNVFDFTLNNAGLVEVTASQMSFRGGGTAGGTWSAGNTATLQLGGATFENTASTAFAGAGRILVQGGTYRLANPQAVNTYLELGTGGVIDGAGTLTINGRFDWTGGVMQGAGKTILSASSTPTIGGGGFIQRTIDNSASVVFTGATGHFQIGQGCVWNNLAGSVFDVKADNYVLGAYGGAATFNNAGTVRRSAGTSLNVFDFTLNNAGLVEVTASQMSFRGGGTAGGTWSAGNTATLQLGGATFENTGSTAFAGAGRILIQGGNYRLANPQAVNTYLELGTGGVIDGAGTLTINGRFDWTGGVMQGAGKTILSASSTPTIGGGGFIQRTIDNSASVVFTGATGHFQIGQGCVWNNLPGSVFDVKADNYVLGAYGGAATFNNAGTVRRSAGTSLNVFDFTLNNAGLVEVTASQTSFRGGGTAGGTWGAGTGATLQFGGATFENTAGTAFTGAGRILVQGATYRLSNPQVIGTWFDLGNGGTLDGSGTLTINGRFDWTGGVMQGTGGKTLFTASSTPTISAGGFIQRTIDNSTTVLFTGTAGHFQIGQGCVWNNLAGSVFDIKADNYVLAAYGGSAQFRNVGIVRRTAGTSSSVFDFQTVNGGSIVLETGRTGWRSGLTQTNGTTRLAGGHLEGAPVLIDIQGGTIEGAGEINTGISIGGTLRPGNPLGKIQVLQNWNTTNTSSSVSIFQLGGKQAGVSYDQFFTGGALNLSGELRVEFANGFEPDGADVFEIMRGVQRRGTFTATNAPSGFSAEVTYSATNVTLRVLKTGIAAPQITQQPVGATVNDGQQAVFSVTASGSGLAYQWRKNNNPIDGANGPQYTINAAQFIDAGSYSVVVSNAGGSVTSDPALLTVNPTSIDSALLARYAFEDNLQDSLGNHHGTTNGTVKYVAGARNKGIRLDGSSWISLGTNPAEPIVNSAGPFSISFWIRPRSVTAMVPIHIATASGDFAVYLSSGLAGDFPTHFGFRTQPFQATTDPKTYIAQYVGCWTEVTVTYNGGPQNNASSYAIYINGESATLNTQVASSVLAGANEIGRNTGGFGAYVNGDLDEVRLYGRALRPVDAVALSANPPDCPPEITQNPQDLSVGLGGAVQFAVTAIGAKPLAYQWWRDTTAVDGGTAATLPINPVKLTDGGTYRVVVTNIFGAVTSAPAKLDIVLPQPPGLATLTLGIPNTIAGASFYNASSGFVSYQGIPGGSGGGVFWTINGGVTWTASNIGVNNSVNAVQFVGAVAYIAGSNGLLCISTNNGASWTPFNTGTTATFNTLTFASSSYGWAAGTGGTICVYNGVQWVPTVTGTTADFYSLGYGGNTLWAVGSGGTICRYVNGAWQAVPTGIGSTFYSVAFRNSNLGLAVGSGGTLCRWNGSTWVAIDTGTSSDIKAVAWADDNTAYIAGNNGLLCISRNGGLTWEPLTTGSQANFGSLAISGGRGYAFGSGGVGFSFVVPVQVPNLPPQIVINTPTNTQQFYACFRIPVTATAIDPDGTVAKVEFYRGQYKLAEFTKPPRGGRPFATAFRTDAFGTYELRAVATDNLGAVTVSEPVTIEVVPPPVNIAIAEELYEEGMAICFMGDEGATYRLQGTVSLEPPSTWVNISTNVMPALLLRVVDPGAVNLPYRFYRFEKLP